MSKKKKILIIALSCVAGAALIVGIGLAVRHSVRGSRAMVVSAQEQAEYEGAGDEISDIEGVVSSGASQSIYLTESMPVKEVKVTEGQQVRKGDVLLVYDTTKAKMNMEKEQLNVSRVENSIQITERNIRTLQSIRPTNGDEYDEDAETATSKKKTKKTTPKKTTPKKTDPTPVDPPADPYKDVVPEETLTAWSQAYNHTTAAGTKADPYRFLCKEGTKIKKEFVDSMKTKAGNQSLWFVLEIHDQDKVAGELSFMWKYDAKQMPNVADGWEWTLSFFDNGPEATGTALGDAAAPRVVLLAVGDGEEDSDDDSASESNSLISSSASYTSEELRTALIEEREKLEDYKLDLKEAQLKLTKAKNALAKGEAKANTDGVVKKVGDPQNPPKDGSAFLQIGEAKGMTVRAGISERKLGRLKPGDKVRINSWQSGEQMTATVDEISPYPDTSGTFSSTDSAASLYPFTANIDETDTQLAEGEWVEVYIGTGVSEEDAGTSLYVMKAFVRDDGEGKYVLKRGKDKKLVKQKIKVGKSSGSSYEVLSGLDPDDWIAFPYGKNATEGNKTREGTVDELYEE